jgi:hypothetical protein
MIELNDFNKILIIIMLLSGIFGGVVSYFLNEDTSVRSVKFKITKDIIVGTGASALVPLFLNMISSDLITNQQDSYSNLYVFAGICLLFSIYAKPIIETMSKQVIKQIQEKQRNTENTLDKLIESQIEPDKEDINSFGAAKDINENDNDHLDNNEKVIRAFMNTRYAFKSQKNIEDDTKLNKNLVEGVLESLIKQRTISFIIRDNQKYYYLTRKGKSELNN